MEIFPERFVCFRAGEFDAALSISVLIAPFTCATRSADLSESSSRIEIGK